MYNAKWVLAILFFGIIGLVMPLPESKRSHMKIVGGEPIEIAFVPYLLSFHCGSIDQHPTPTLCSASIIGASWGITAAHCMVFGINPENYYVRAQSTEIEIGGSLHKILKLYTYNTSLFPNTEVFVYDIMLFKVTKRFKLSDTLKSLKLPDAGIISPEWLQVSGYGETIEGDTRSALLTTADVYKVRSEECLRNNGNPTEINKNRYLCYDGRRQHSCHGDSGGPLSDTETIYGIVSFGVKCAEPAAYTNVSYYRSWIKQITNL